MHEQTNIRLSAADRSELETVAANRNSPQKHVWRAKIVLLTADGPGLRFCPKGRSARNQAEQRPQHLSSNRFRCSRGLLLSRLIVGIFSELHSTFTFLVRRI